uniref:Uncharacterized protein n=1 Tax=Setaria italica TaxID=4555 RepID=K3YEA9_SETIT
MISRKQHKQSSVSCGKQPRSLHAATVRAIEIKINSFAAAIRSINLERAAKRRCRPKCRSEMSAGSISAWTKCQSGARSNGRRTSAWRKQQQQHQQLVWNLKRASSISFDVRLSSPIDP